MDHFIIYYRGKILFDKKSANTNLWAGLFSIAHKNGSIVQFIKKYIQNKDVVLLLFCLDGDITMDLVNIAMKYVSDDLKNKKIIVGVLADKNRIIPFPSHVKKLYMPLDDDLFFKRR